jgi:hypothetical protein
VRQERSSVEAVPEQLCKILVANRGADRKLVYTSLHVKYPTITWTITRFWKEHSAGLYEEIPFASQRSVMESCGGRRHIMSRLRRLIGDIIATRVRNEQSGLAD